MRFKIRNNSNGFSWRTKSISGILLLFCGLISMYAYSQEKKQDGIEINYDDGTTLVLKSVATNPFSYPQLSFSAGLNFGTFAQNVIDFKVPVQAEYNLPHLGFLRFNAEVPVVPRWNDQFGFLKNQPELRTTNEFRPHWYSEGLLGFSIVDRTINARTRLAMETKYTFDKETNYVTHMKLPQRFIFSFRVGFHRYQSILSNIYLDSDSLITEDGEVLSRARFEPEAYINTNDPDERKFHTNMIVNSPFVGLDLKKIKQVVVEIDDEQFDFKTRMNFFLDVFLFPSIHIDDMMVRDLRFGTINPRDVVHNKGGGFEISKSGFRVGFNYTPYVSNHSAISINYEMGIKPGVTNFEARNALLGKRAYGLIRIMYTWGSAL